MTDLEQNDENKEVDVNNTVVWRPFGLIQIECTNLHRIIEDGSVNIPKVRGIIPTLTELSKLMFTVIVAFIRLCLTLVATLLSIIYILVKETFIITFVIN